MTSARKHKLRQKLCLTAPKPRNPLVAQAARRKAGKHVKSASAQRQEARRTLRKLIKEDDV